MTTISFKTCTTCGESREAHTFVGKSLKCKPCRSAWQKEWYANNREHKLEQCRQLYLKNRDRIRARHKDYTLKNLERVRFKINEWHKAVRRGEKGGQAHLKIKVKCLIKNIFKGERYSKTSNTAALLGCSYEELFIFVGDRPSKDHHLDHICPCAQALNEEEFIKLQHYSNLRWLPAIENLSKSDNRTPEGEEMCRKLLGREWVDFKRTFT